MINQYESSLSDTEPIDIKPRILKSSADNNSQKLKKANDSLSRDVDSIKESKELIKNEN